MTNRLRIVFMGTPDFAAVILNTLHAHHYNLVAVVTVPDRPAGRGRQLRPSAVKQAAIEQNIPLLQPEKLKAPKFLAQIRSYEPDVFVVVAFRMLPQVLWKLPPKGTFNLHASLLPQYRGAAPINWAIINGEHLTGVTTFFIDDQIDTGDIIDHRTCPIEKDDNASSLHDKLMILGGDLVMSTIDAIDQGQAKPKAQNTQGPLRSAPKLNAENTRINWGSTAEMTVNLIRGLDTYPGAWTTLLRSGEVLKVKINQAKRTGLTANRAPGSIDVTKKSLHVHTANEQLSITLIQFPGKKKMPIEALLNGYSFENEDKFV